MTEGDMLGVGRDGTGGAGTYNRNLSSASRYQRDVDVSMR